MPLLLIPYSSASVTKGFISMFAFWMGGAGAPTGAVVFIPIVGRGPGLALVSQGGGLVA